MAQKYLSSIQEIVALSDDEYQMRKISYQILIRWPYKTCVWRGMYIIKNQRWGFEQNSSQ